VKIMAAPTHAASKPIAIIPNCAATRHAHFTLDGSGVAKLERAFARRMAEGRMGREYGDQPARGPEYADEGTRSQHGSPARTLLLSGKMLTGRDAAHKRIADMLAKGEKLPVDFTNRVIYYVGPGGPRPRRSRWPGRPDHGRRAWTSFTDMMLSQTGLISMIGKAERRPGCHRGDQESTRPHT